MTGMDSLTMVRDHLPGYRQHWMYTENGRPLMVVARYDKEGDKTFRQFRPNGDEWEEGMCSAPYALFGLGSLSRHFQSDAIFVCEGEKCAALLHQLSLPAIATVLGAQNPPKSDWTPMRHYKRFVVLRDNDPAGINFTRAVACELLRLSPEAEILVVNLAPTIEGGDLIDWAQATVMLGQDWNGFDAVPADMKPMLLAALHKEVEAHTIDVAECPEVDFKPLEARFNGPPRPLKRTLAAVPPFPLNVYPPAVREYLDLLSQQVSQVPDFAGTVFLLAIAGLLGRSVGLTMRPQTRWQEVANAWGAIVGSPATKKSPILRTVLGFFRVLEDTATEEYRIALREYKARERQAKEAKADFDEEPPTRRRYITDDVTMPKLREVLAHNHRGVLLRNDELKGQLERLDKAGNEGDRSFMMSCWSGLEVYSEDRIGRGSHINVPIALTWIGCIPPPALQRYLREAMGLGSGADGFMQRFQFLAYPDTNARYELSTATISDDLQQSVQDCFLTLDARAQQGSRTLRFSDEAQLRFNTWLAQHETDARSGRHPLHWESHLCKQSKALAVSAIVLHCLYELANSSESSEVSLETLEGALVLREYFEAHAHRCYESIVGVAIDDAHTILRLLRDKRIPQRFKSQDIYRNGHGGLDDSGRVQAALELLEDYGWVICEKVPAGPKGGRRHEFWTLHPRAFESH